MGKTISNKSKRGVYMYKEELEVIKQAILNEVEGYEFYKLASEKAVSGGSKDAFLELANEELKHVEYLKELFDKIKGNPTEDFELAFNTELPSPGIYKWEKMDVDMLALAMSVFGIGMQMEKDSIEFYKKAKENTKFEAAAKLYDTLIKWEFVHLNQFTEQYEMYRKDWWNEQNFAPY
jgi:rubrerythrin